jgi:uncharacterized protein YdeI (YjbR/CyaY-like superfamily)
VSETGPSDGLPIVSFVSAGDLTAWLEENHAASPGVWLKIAKKGSGHRSVTHSEALDVALRFGWIDGQRKALDDAWFLQRFTPRRSRSRWSKINRDRAAELISLGEMRPAGLAEVERAKADGRWDAAYDSPSNITVPDDLQRALDENPAAREVFASLNGQNRYAILYRVHDAKRPETRARRIAQFVEMLAEGRTPYP